MRQWGHHYASYWKQSRYFHYTPPTDLITPGVLTVGSDTTYPPQEYIDPTTNKATGFDVDLITAIAQRMGLQSKYCSHQV